MNRMLSTVSEQLLCDSSRGRFCVVTHLYRNGEVKGSGSRVVVGSAFDIQLPWNVF